MPKPVKEWSDHIANLADDALVDAKLIRKEDFAAAAGVIAVEILARLGMGDYPANPIDEPE